MATSSHTRGAFSFETSRCPILSTGLRFGWKRELSCFQGQNLPEALFGHNYVSILHAYSNVRISFSVLECLRSWASLDVKPIRVQGAWEIGGERRETLSRLKETTRH